MKRLLLLCSILAATAAHAIDRDAVSIERVQVTSAMLDHGDSVSAQAFSETAVDPYAGTWAILAALGIGVEDPDTGPDADTWSVALGIKCYVARLTSIALLGSYERSDPPERDTSAWAGEVRLRQRILDPAATVSPYLEGRAALAEVKTPAPETGHHTFVAVRFAALLGIEFAMRDDFSIVFEGGYTESEDIDDGYDPADGWIAAVAMQYYWF